MVFSIKLSFSQFEYGLKGGLNFDSSGDILVVTDQLEKKGNLDGKSGYHLGVYAEVDFLILYLRPELQFTKVSTQYETIDNNPLIVVQLLIDYLCIHFSITPQSYLFLSANCSLVYNKSPLSLDVLNF